MNFYRKTAKLQVNFGKKTAKQQVKKSPLRYRKGLFWRIFVARAGFEPTHAEPKSAVLPLDDRAIIFSGAKVMEKIIPTKFLSKKI